jgi:predicted dehydrogenase
MKKIILCGFGFMGQTHAANILAHPELELAAVVTIIPKDQIKPVSGNIATGALDFAQLKDIPFFFTLEEALAGCQSDAVLIATPTDFHVPMALEAIAAGKHVFVEKPLCFTEEESDKLLAALEGKDLIFQVGHCVRFFPEYTYVAELVKNGKYGKLRHFTLCRQTGIPAWGAWNEQKPHISSAAGPLYDLNIHDIDFALSLLGKPEKLAASRVAGTDMLFKAELLFSDSTPVTIDGGFFPLPETPFRAGYTAIFDEAVLEFDCRTGVQLTQGGKSEKVEITGPSGYVSELAAFSDAMEGKPYLKCTAAEAASAVDVCRKLAAHLMGNNMA